MDEIKLEYRKYLSDKYAAATVQTAVVDAFYIWRKAGADVFWKTINSLNFEDEAKIVLEKILAENSSGSNVELLVKQYLGHLRRFKKYINGKAAVGTVNHKIDLVIPKPSRQQLLEYLDAWNEQENYRLQEKALNQLFFELCPANKDMSDILIKASVLNDFYSTNIYSIYSVAKHIYELDIDKRLKVGDVTLVNDLKKVVINGSEKNFYSFATKYCSHHNPLDYPIYDRYVDKLLCYFRDTDKFSLFKNSELKNYINFKSVLLDFREFYELNEFNLKQIDRYIWQLGKKYFAKNYRTWKISQKIIQS